MFTPNMEERASPLRARPILSLRPMVGGKICRFGFGEVSLLLLLENGDCWPAADTTGGGESQLQGVTQATYVAEAQRVWRWEGVARTWHNLTLGFWGIL